MLWHYADERYGRGTVEKVIKQGLVYAIINMNEHIESIASMRINKMRIEFEGLFLKGLRLWDGNEWFRAKKLRT